MPTESYFIRKVLHQALNRASEKVDKSPGLLLNLLIEQYLDDLVEKIKRELV